MLSPRRFWHCAFGLAVSLLAVGQYAEPLRAEDRAAGPLPLVQAYLQRYCIECHSGETPKGGLKLSSVRSLDHVLRKRKTWENLLDLVEGESMPPDDKLQPTETETAVFVRTVRGVFDEYDRNAKPDPGRVTMRRLNRAEYDATIRDLFYGLEADMADDFPADDVGHGFDNIGDVLSMSPVLMERYLAAAEMLSKQVVLVELPKVVSRKERAMNTRPPLPREDRKARFRDLTTDPNGAPHETGPVWSDSLLSGPDEYVFKVTCYAERAEELPVRIALFIAGPQLTHAAADAEIEPFCGKNVAGLQPLRILGTYEVTARDEKHPQTIEVRFSTTEEINRTGVALIKTPADSPTATVHLQSLSIEGPLDVRPYAMRRLLECTSDKPRDEQTREILQRFATRAFRRPATSSEVDRLCKLVQAAAARGESWEAGLQCAIQAVLASPKFLFRAELDDRPTSPDTRALDEFQLASRLSYFLWGSMPDDELFSLAAQGKLTSRLDAQVRRMLQDRKSRALIDQFAMQWLQLGRLKTLAPDATLFPKFNEVVRQAMLQETQLFLAAVIREDRSILDLIDSDFTFMNGPLANFYHVVDTNGNTWEAKKSPKGKPFSGDQWLRVTFSDGTRGGLMTQASVLTATSNPTRTSPVKRGKWVLEQLLGEPPPPPPANVPELEQQKDKLTGSLRQRMEQHRTNPACANCHAKMDQLGFAFENFDAVGVYRQKDGNDPIDPSGTLPGGKTFRGPAELRKILAENKDGFARCLTEKLLTFALGRGLEYYDDRAVDRIVAALRNGGYKFSTLCTEIARSDPFRLRRGASAPVEEE